MHLNPGSLICTFSDVKSFRFNDTELTNTSDLSKRKFDIKRVDEEPPEYGMVLDRTIPTNSFLICDGESLIALDGNYLESIPDDKQLLVSHYTTCST